MMHWSILIIVAGVLNATLNAVYKSYSTTNLICFMQGGAVFIGALLLLLYAFTTQAVVFNTMLTTKNIALVLAMGIATPIVFIFMIKAFAKAGPISLVDPLWACLYALVSLLIGIAIAGENPSVFAMGGISLYVLGAYLMARG